MKAPDDILAAAIRLKKACLLFDWQGGRSTDLLEEESNRSLLILPLKRTKSVSDDV